MCIQLSLLSLLVFACPALAGDETEKTEHALPLVLWERLKSNSLETWHAPQHDSFYLPVISWHPPFAWDKDQREQYNENPWGAGYGRTRFDADGNWHGLYLMVFKDSQYHWEPVAGYGYEKIWRPWDQHRDLRLGLGLTAGLTMRDNWHYIPVPYLLPLASVGYKNLSFQATFVPGPRHKANVLFGWLRWEFD